MIYIEKKPPKIDGNLPYLRDKEYTNFMKKSF